MSLDGSSDPIWSGKKKYHSSVHTHTHMHTHTHTLMIVSLFIDGKKERRKEGSRRDEDWRN